MVRSFKVGDVRWTIRRSANDMVVSYVEPWKGEITSLYTRQVGLREDTQRIYDMSADAYLCRFVKYVPDTNDGALAGANDLFETELEAWQEYRKLVERDVKALQERLVAACDKIKELLCERSR